MKLRRRIYPPERYRKVALARRLAQMRRARRDEEDNLDELEILEWNEAKELIHTVPGSPLLDLAAYEEVMESTQ